MLAGENFDKFSYLDYLGEKTLANSFQLNTGIKGSVKLREKTLAIGHQFAKFANVFCYRIAQNVGGGKHWRIWRLSVNSPNFSHPNIINTLKCNGTLTKFAKVFPSKCTDGTISPKFYPANILRYTVYDTLHWSALFCSNYSSMKIWSC